MDEVMKSEAVIQLKIVKQSRDVSSKKPSPVKRLQKEPDQDLVPVLHNQSEYIQHLEAEVKFFKEELEEFKGRVKVVLVENERLSFELKSKEESFQDQTNSMERLRVLHKSQIQGLEAQVVSLRKDLSVSRQEGEELKVLQQEGEELKVLQQEGEELKVLQQEGEELKVLPDQQTPGVAGLCLRCGQHEGLTSSSHADVQTLHRVNKERNELVMTLNTVRRSQEEAQQREWSACLQVKQAVEMVEEANVQKAKVEMQREQLSREMIRQRERLQHQVKTMTRRLAAAREDGLSEGRRQREELTNTVSGLSQQVAQSESQLNRCLRDRSSLTSELEVTLRRLTSLEQEHSKVCVDLQDQIHQAQLQRQEAQRDVQELNLEISRNKMKTSQEVERLNLELVGLQQHLEKVQDDGSQWQTEAVRLAEQLAEAQRQLHLTRQEKDASDQKNEEKTTSETQWWRNLEKDLTSRLQQTESHYQSKVAEQDLLLSSMDSLVSRLKDQCCMLGVTLEELVAKNRTDLQQQKLKMKRLEETLTSVRARSEEMEDQCVQHGRTHQCMKDRLLQLDQHCQTSGQQVCELLTKQNQLMQEKHNLSEEIHILQTQIQNFRRVDFKSTR